VGYVKHIIASWSRELIVPLYAELVWFHLDYCVQFCVPQYKKDIKLLACPAECDQDLESSQGQDVGGAAEVTWFVQLREEKAEG